MAVGHTRHSPSPPANALFAPRAQPQRKRRGGEKHSCNESESECFHFDETPVHLYALRFENFNASYLCNWITHDGEWSPALNRGFCMNGRQTGSNQPRPIHLVAPAHGLRWYYADISKKGRQSVSQSTPMVAMTQHTVKQKHPNRSNPSVVRSDRERNSPRSGEPSIVVTWEKKH